MKTQKECVYESIMKYFTRNKISFKEGQNAGEMITTEGRKAIHEFIYEGFKSGQVALKTEMNDETLHNYIPGLLSNHLRKDTRLNGGDKYVPENPGKYTGNSDPQIREMRKLLKIVAGTEKEAAVQAGLDKLVAAWKAANAKEKTIEIDASLIPEEYRALVG